MEGILSHSSQVTPSSTTLVPVSLTVRNVELGFNLSSIATSSSNAAINEMGNISSTGSYSTLIPFLLGTLYALNIILSFIGNLFVVIAVATTHRLKTTTNYLLMSLAVADLTISVLVMPYALAYDISGKWHFGRTFCLFWMSWDVMCCTASLQHLCAVSVDRYLAIHDPLHYYERMSSQKALIIVVVIWLNSSCISFIPVFMGWYKKVGHETPAGQCFLNINQTYAVLSASVSFYIPCIIMGVCYFKILSVALQQAKEIQKMQRSVQHNFEDSQCLTNKSKSLASERKAIKTLGIIFGMFYICWQPFFIIYWIYAFAVNPDIPNWVRSTITWLGYINSAANPIVYALNPDFRAAYKRIFYSVLRGCGLCPQDGDSGRYGMYNNSGPPPRNSSPLTIPDTDNMPCTHSSSTNARNYASLGITETPMSQLNGVHTSDQMIDETALNPP